MSGDFVDRPTYVVLQPHSNSNPTRFYRVVSMRAWVAHTDQIGTDVPAPAGTNFEAYDAAQAYRDQLNWGSWQGESAA